MTIVKLMYWQESQYLQFDKLGQWMDTGQLSNAFLEATLLAIGLIMNTQPAYAIWDFIGASKF